MESIRFDFQGAPFPKRVIEVFISTARQWTDSQGALMFSDTKLEGTDLTLTFTEPKLSAEAAHIARELQSELTSLELMAMF